MSWYEKLLETAKDVAPTVAGGAATIASGGNPAMGMLVSSVMSKVLGQPVEDMEVAAKDILADPHKTYEFRKEMRKADLRELELRSEDTKSARKLIKHSKGPVTISSIVTVSFAIMIFLVMFVSIPASSQAVAYLLLGTLATAFSQVLNFWLGTSLGSKEKDSTISKFAEAAKQDQNMRSNK